MFTYKNKETPEFDNSSNKNVIQVMGELDLHKPDFEKEDEFFATEKRRNGTFDEETSKPFNDREDEIEVSMVKGKKTMVFK